jgi:hypothetical protein
MCFASHRFAFASRHLSQPRLCSPQHCCNSTKLNITLTNHTPTRPNRTSLSRRITRRSIAYHCRYGTTLHITITALYNTLTHQHESALHKYVAPLYTQPISTKTRPLLAGRYFCETRLYLALPQPISTKPQRLYALLPHNYTALHDSFTVQGLCHTLPLE